MFVVINFFLLFFFSPDWFLVVQDFSTGFSTVVARKISYDEFLNRLDNKSVVNEAMSQLLSLKVVANFPKDCARIMRRRSTEYCNGNCQCDGCTVSALNKTTCTTSCDCGAGYTIHGSQRCQPCSAGKYKSGGRNTRDCIACPSGKYQPDTEKSSCLTQPSCGAGTM